MAYGLLCSHRLSFSAHLDSLACCCFLASVQAARTPEPTAPQTAAKLPTISVTAQFGHGPNQSTSISPKPAPMTAPRMPEEPMNAMVMTNVAIRDRSVSVTPSQLTKSGAATTAATRLVVHNASSSHLGAAPRARCAGGLSVLIWRRVGSGDESRQRCLLGSIGGLPRLLGLAAPPDKQDQHNAPHRQKRGEPRPAVESIPDTIRQQAVPGDREASGNADNKQDQKQREDHGLLACRRARIWRHLLVDLMWPRICSIRNAGLFASAVDLAARCLSAFTASV